MSFGKLNFRCRILFTIILSHCFQPGFAGDVLAAKRTAYVYHIARYFPKQLTNPQLKNRRNFSQFGYNLSYFQVQLFPITNFINPKNFGVQSYGQPNKKEKNGSLYTCRGSFMDFSHIRCAVDWTVFLTFKIITENGDFNLPSEAGSLKLHFSRLDELTLEDIVSLAQKITFERLVWHEVASWHYRLPNYSFSEQQSTFTPEDVYSDFLGTVIGRNVALRILQNMDSLPYSKIATQEIAKMISSLNPLTSKRASARAYDIVDRYKQLKLPMAKRNKDIWWDSNIIFIDERYCFKRYMNIGPDLAPWLVPTSKKLGCPVHPNAEVLHVPQQTKAGVSFYDYYDFTISPDSVLFYAKLTGKELFRPFGAFNTQHFAPVVNLIRDEMEEKLLPDFDKRNSLDPVPSFKGVKKVLFK